MSKSREKSFSDRLAEHLTAIRRDVATLAALACSGAGPYSLQTTVIRLIRDVARLDLFLADAADQERIKAVEKPKTAATFWI